MVGAGAIGGVVGARLGQHGHPVILVARGAHRAAIAEHGLVLRTPVEQVCLRLPVVSDPAEVDWQSDDVVLLAVKSQQTGPVLDRLATSAPAQVAIVCLQNGVENERAALRLFPHVYAVPVLCPAGHLQPGTVESYAVRTTGILDIGRYPSGADELAGRISAAFAGSGFVSQVRADVMRWKWAKLLVNLGNAVEALFGPHEVPADLLRRARQEGADVLAAAGIDVASRQEDSARRGDLLEPVRGQSSHSPTGSARPGGSSWQSLARATGTIETDYLTGEIVLLGRLHGVPTPVNELLQQLARRAATDRRPPGGLTVQEFVAALPSGSMDG